MSRTALASMMGTDFPDWADHEEALQATTALSDLNGRVHMLWHSGYWDGPLSGACTVDGEPGYWFKCTTEEDDSWTRYYVVCRLTEEQWELKQARHAAFCQHVCGENGYHPSEQHTGYYDREFPQEPPLEWSQAVGWATTLRKEHDA